MRIFTDIVFLPSKPSWRNADFAEETIDATRSGFCIRAAPRVSAQAQDWGQPQLMSMPFTWGARSVVVRAISRGELTPSWAIVGGGLGEVVKSGEAVVS